MRLTLIYLALVSLWTSSLTWAQNHTVYRCDNLYADQPCPNGQTLEFTAIGTQRVRDRQKQTQQDVQQAQQLQRERESSAQRLQQQANKTPRPTSPPIERHADEKSKRVIQPSFKARAPKSTEPQEK